MTPLPSKPVENESSEFLSGLEARLRERIPNVEHRVVPSVARAPGEFTVDAAKQKRKREFELGRRCTDELLLRLDSSGPVGTNPDRSPSWPNGIVGSITHSTHWTWAAVAKEDNFRSIGIDTELIVEPHTLESIQMMILSDKEAEVLQDSGLNPLQSLSVAFSAKEAFYKCWYPIRAEFFGFKQAEIESASSDHVRIRSLQDNPNFGDTPAALDVFYYVTEQDVFTFTWIEQN